MHFGKTRGFIYQDEHKNIERAQPFVIISSVWTKKVEHLSKLIFWVIKIESKWKKTQRNNVLQGIYKLMFEDIALGFFLHGMTNCDTFLRPGAWCEVRNRRQN